VLALMTLSLALGAGTELGIKASDLACIEWPNEIKPGLTVKEAFKLLPSGEFWCTKEMNGDITYIFPKSHVRVCFRSGRVLSVKRLPIHNDPLNY
jgi:hypothetical protein